MHSNDQVPSIISEIVDAGGGVLKECVNDLGDGSGFATASFPLPEDHWLYETTPEGYTPRPHYPMRAPGQSKARDYLSRMIAEHGGQYGVKAATMNGRELDFDPDALVRNIEIGLFGVFTADGLNGMGDGHLFDPIDTSPTLAKVLLETVALAIHDGLLTPNEVIEGITAHSVAEARDRQTAREEQRRREYEEWARARGFATEAEVSADHPDVPPAPTQENSDA